MPEQKTVPCPNCRRPVALDAPEMPFCSDRCRLLDLGAWASGDYKISSPILDPEVYEEVEAAQLAALRQGTPTRDDSR